MRILTALLLLLAFGLPVLPAAAQDAESPLDWIPADFDGFLRVDLTRPGETLSQLNIAYLVASSVQPNRADGSFQRTYEDYFPVDLFDTEGVDFDTTVLPWLTDEFVIAYRTLGDDFAAGADDVLLILPTDDAFAAASVLSEVTKAQDFPVHTEYGETPIFVGDQTAIAYTPTAILVGAEPTLHVALDTMRGEGAQLVDSPTYAALSATSDDWPLFAYFSGDAPQHALSVLLSGGSSVQPALRAVGEALQAYNADSLEAALLSGAVDAVAVGLRADSLRATLEARVMVQTSVDAAVADAAGESDVLAYIPRNAMLVQQGDDAQVALYDALVAAPASGYFNSLLSSAFANPGATGTGAAAAPTIEPPDTDSIQAAVSGFVTALSGVGGFDLEEDLTAHLDGGYALALLPRPNNPTPSGAPYDVLLVAETTDADAAMAGVTTLAQTLLALDDDAIEDTPGDADVRAVYGASNREPLLQIGVVDDKLVVGTGSAVETALRAGTGDNRLVNVSRWQDVSREAEPMLYLDLNALLATFAPTAGGPVDSGIGQLGLSVHSQGEGRYHIDVIVTVPALL